MGNPDEPAESTVEAAASQTGRFRRLLGRVDILFLCLVATVNLNLIPTVAAAGPLVLVLWLVAAVIFVLPQGVAITEVSRRYPGEAGLSAWATHFFGRYAGFQTAWCYWANNVVYVPSLVLFVVSNLLFLMDPAASRESHGALLLVVSVAALWAVAGLTIVGFGVSRWLQNAGALCTLLALAVLGVIAVRAVVVAGEGPPAFTGDQTDWKVAAAFGVVCLSMIGIELGTVLGDEIRNSASVVPWTVWRASLTALGCYVLGVVALLVALPAGKISALEGFSEAASAIAGEDAGWLVPCLGGLVTLSVAAAAVAWFAGASRMLWAVAAQVRPPLARLHPARGTPVAAILIQAVLSSAVLCVASIGTSARQVYLLLLDLTVVLQLVPYLTMFCGLVRAGAAAPRRRLFLLAGGAGAISTLAGIALAFVPSRQVDSVLWHQAGLCAGVSLFIGGGTVVYLMHGRCKPPALN